jgi:hypothetical protein
MMYDDTGAAQRQQQKIYRERLVERERKVSMLMPACAPISKKKQSVHLRK